MLVPFASSKARTWRLRKARSAQAFEKKPGIALEAGDHVQKPPTWSWVVMESHPGHPTPSSVRCPTSSVTPGATRENTTTPLTVRPKAAAGGPRIRQAGVVHEDRQQPKSGSLQILKWD